MENLEGGEINPHWAHDSQQRAEYLLAELQEHAETRDLSAIEKELSEVFAKLGELIEVLDCIHRPHSLDQHDEDHSFTDEQWAALKVIGRNAEANLANAADAVSQASKQLDEAFVGELDTFRRQLKQVQSSLKRVKL